MHMQLQQQKQQGSNLIDRIASASSKCSGNAGSGGDRIGVGPAGRWCLCSAAMHMRGLGLPSTGDAVPSTSQTSHPSSQINTTIIRVSRHTFVIGTSLSHCEFAVSSNTALWGLCNQLG